MRIVNPCFGVEPASADLGSGAPLARVDWGSAPIALISNSKPNARELLQGVRSLMAEVRDVGNIDFHAKTSAAFPAPEAMNADIASRYKGAILALADWGSCSSWSFHDSVELEKLGVETHFVVTESFVPLVTAQAEIRRVKPRMLVVKHPVGGLNETELRERIDAAYAELRKAVGIWGSGGRPGRRFRNICDGRKGCGMTAAADAEIIELADLGSEGW